MEYNANCMVIKSAGMYTSLGTSAQASAAFRCAMSREKELTNMPYYDSAEYQQHFIKAHSAMDSSEGFQGLARVIILGATALADLQQNCGDTKLNTAKTGLYLCFPEQFEFDPALEMVGNEVQEFIERLEEESQVPLNKTNMEVYYEGITGVAEALEQAHRALLEERYEQCIVGSIDSLLLQNRISELIVNDDIKTADTTYGLIPGEAACFVLLETVASARRNKTQADLTIVAYSQQMGPYDPQAGQKHPDAQAEEQQDDASPEAEQDAQEPVDDKIALQSQSVATAITQTTQYLQPLGEDAGVIYCDLNGQQQKVTVLSNGLIKAHGVHDVPLGHWKLETPAVNFGDTGTSNVLLSLILAANASKKAILKGNKAIIIAATDYGDAVTIGVGA